MEERVSKLSLGQRQLLAFARALVPDAPILILDEATASIDSESELMLQQALDQLPAFTPSISPPLMMSLKKWSGNT
jgi:ABC-type multidrug transport system fused ATPase/permease subunit